MFSISPLDTYIYFPFANLDTALQIASIHQSAHIYCALEKLSMCTNVHGNVHHKLCAYAVSQYEC